MQIEWEFGSWRQLYLLTWTAKKIGILEKPVQNRQKQQDIYCFELMRAIFVLFLAGRKDKI